MRQFLAKNTSNLSLIKSLGPTTHSQEVDTTGIQPVNTEGGNYTGQTTCLFSEENKETDETYR